jgi:membrane protein implicated in regulation of membrane protease activity
MYLWICVGVVLLIIEILTSTFFILFFALAALSIALLLYFILIPLHIQVLIFACISVLYVAFLRKALKYKKKQPPLFVMDEEFLGKRALVHKSISLNLPGKVLIGDTLWKATSHQEIPKGQKVKIISQNNLTLEVELL